MAPNKVSSSQFPKLIVLLWKLYNRYVTMAIIFDDEKSKHCILSVFVLTTITLLSTGTVLTCSLCNTHSKMQTSYT